MTAPPRLSFPSSQVAGRANRAIVNRGWLTSAGAARTSWWTTRLTKTLNSVAELCPPSPLPPTPHTHIPVSLGPNCQRHKGGQRLWAPGPRCDHESLLALAEECTMQEEKEAKKTHHMLQLFWSVVPEWVITLACCRLERDLSVRLLQKPTCHAMLGSPKETAGNYATAERLQWVASLIKCPPGERTLTQLRLLRSHQIQILTCGGGRKPCPAGCGVGLNEFTAGQMSHFQMSSFVV